MKPTNPYRMLRAFLAGKRIYKATKNGKKRVFFASSKEQAQAKFTTWEVSKLISIGRK